ncbi:hypothetical protein Hanom_Chr04g00381341 [Helianthus anomalus]
MNVEVLNLKIPSSVFSTLCTTWVLAMADHQVMFLILMANLARCDDSMKQETTTF